jgi:hypothetical protein
LKQVTRALDVWADLQALRFGFNSRECKEI